MMDGAIRPVVQRLARLTAPAESDAVLLERFVASRDEAAFRGLVDRHGGLVLGVCRRALGHTQDAEDAFQATFLVLARRAARVRNPDSLACWLHAVANRAAVKLRAARPAPPPARAAAPTPPADAAAAWRELQAIFDEEVARLPARYREPIVFCALGDLTLAEAASRLGCPPGTVKSRLARARERLRARLLRRGIAPGLSGLALTLSAGPGAAALPSRFREATVTLALAPAPGPVTRLADAVPGAALGVRVTSAAAAIGVLLVGVVWAAGPNAVEPVPATPATDRPATEAVLPGRVDRLGDPLPEGALARLGTERFRHMHTVRSAVFTADGQGVITRSWDSTSRVWSFPDGRELRRVAFPFLLPEKEDPGDDRWAVIAPDGTTGLSYRKDGRLRFTDLRTGRAYREVEVPELQAPGSFLPGAFRPDGRVVAVLGKGVVRLWDVPAGREVRQLPVPYPAGDLILSPDGKTLAIVHPLPKAANGGEPGAIGLWDVATGKEVRQLSGHADRIYQAAFSPDGKRLVTGAGIQDRTVRAWDVATGVERWRSAGPEGWVRPVAFSPDGATVAAGGQDGVIRLLDAASGKETRQFRIPGQDDVWGPWAMSVAFSPDGKTLASCGTEKAVRFWDLATGREKAVSGHQDEVTAVAVSPDGKTAFSAARDSAVCVWDLATGRERGRWLGHRNGVHGLALSPDGRTLISAGNTVRVWDVASRETLRELKGHAGPVDSVAFAPDGKTVATASSDDHTIRLWDPATGRLLRTLELSRPNQPEVVPVAFAAGGRLLASGSGDHGNPAVIVWDVAAGKVVRQVSGGGSRLAIAPDGRAVAGLGHDGMVRLFEPESGAEIAPPTAGGGAVAFSPDGSTLAVGGGDGTVRLLEAATGYERRRWAAHRSGQIGRMTFSAGVSCLSFTPDGRTLVTGAGDTTLLIWRVWPRPAGPAAPAARRAEWWAELAADPDRAYRAMGEMGSAPVEAVAELRKHLHPVAAPPAGRVAELVRQLGSDRFTDRERAAAALAALGEGAVPLLRAAQERASAEETRARLGVLLKRLQDTRSGDRLRPCRAVEVLEQVRTAEARTLLETLARGEAGAALTEAARSAADRLARFP